MARNDFQIFDFQNQLTSSIMLNTETIELHEDVIVCASSVIEILCSTFLQASSEDFFVLQCCFISYSKKFSIRISNQLTNK